MDEDTLKQLFEKSQSINPDKIQFSKDESTKFQKAFEDPEFRKLFSDYIDELQDPKNREENEAYISQLENEKKVPEGKELIRPEPGFVVKTHKIDQSNKKEKLFVNIVQSDKIAEPSKTSTPEGNCWSVPYSLGPPHMEKDKKDENAPCFDCCFHPEALVLSKGHKEFRDLLVHTGMEGVEQMYKNQNQHVVLERSFHVVKGLTYKQGPVPTMMIPVASKSKWSATSTAHPSAKGGKKTTDAPSSSALNKGVKITEEEQASVAKVVSYSSATNGSGQPAIKKGFLTSAKSAIYGDKLTTLRGKTADSGSGKANVLLSEASPSLQDSALRHDESRAAIISEINGAERHQALRTPVAAETLLTAVSTSRKPLSNLDKAVNTEADKASVGVVAELLRCDTASEVVTPQYSVKERGVAGMGDFEAMRRSAAQVSCRPNELVYRIELPLVTKASHVVLDVSARQLILTYLNVYALTVALPYPVHDTRGSAKFDKATKSLTVTLPVVAATLQFATRQPDAVSVSAANDTLTDDVSDDDSGATKKGDIAAGGRPAAAERTTRHSRWVADQGDAVSSVHPGLREEILQNAERAVLDAHNSVLQSTADATAGIGLNSSIAPNNATPPVVVSGTFSASAQFAGRKEGFVFRLGDRGLGYYIDATQQQRQLQTQSSPPPQQHAAVELTDSLVLAQQTPHALALLLQVANIVRDSVEIQFREFGVDLRFCALGTTATLQKYAARIELRQSICSGGLKADECTYDVAGGNMALVLTKQRDCLWSEAPLFTITQVPVVEDEREPPADLHTTLCSADGQLSDGVGLMTTTSSSSSDDKLREALRELQLSSGGADLLYDLD